MEHRFEYVYMFIRIFYNLIRSLYHHEYHCAQYNKYIIAHCTRKKRKKLKQIGRRNRIDECWWYTHMHTVKVCTTSLLCLFVVYSMTIASSYTQLLPMFETSFQ